MPGPRARWTFPLLALATLTLSGCAQEGVSNMTDSFSYGGQVAGRDDTRTYTWKVTGTTVQVSWGGQSAEGTFDLILKDGAGQQVLTRTLGGAQQSGIHETLHNVKPGDWQVTLAFHGFTGQMGLSLLASGAGGPGSYCPPGVPYC